MYSLVVVPSTILWTVLHDGGVVAVTARLTATLVVVALLVTATRPPTRWSARGAWVAALAGVLVALAVAAAAAVFPGLAIVVIYPAVPTALLAWCLAAAGILLTAVRRRNAPMMQISLGLLLLAGAHLYRVSAGLYVLHADLVFDGVRLLALLLVLVGMIRMAAVGLQAVRTERWVHEEELLLAAVHMRRAAERAAERDHELRNGLVNLSGVMAVLSLQGRPEEQQLRSGVLRELTRLSAMIDRGDPERTEHRYDVEPVLRDLVAVRRACGETISLEIAAGLRADATAAVLAQVVTNRLANCARHAPGTAVRVRADHRGSRVIVEVHDDGRGISPGQQQIILERGVRSPATGGQGLGLHVSRQLLAGEGGVLRILPDGPGCTAVVELVRAADTAIGPGSDSAVGAEWDPIPNSRPGDRPPAGECPFEPGRRTREG